MTTTFTFVSAPGEKAPEPRGASLEELVRAIVELSRLDEGQLVELATKGEIGTVLPYALRPRKTPELESWDEVDEAPGRALSDEEYERWLRDK